MEVKVVMRPTHLRDGKWVSARHYRWGKIETQSLPSLLRRAMAHGVPADEIVSVAGPDGVRARRLDDWLKPKEVRA